MSEWKYVKRDGLPTEEDTYIVAVVHRRNVHRRNVKNRYLYRDYFFADTDTWERYNDDYPFEVYAWREMPDPPPYEPDEQS